jgi:hypothetical protein
MHETPFQESEIVKLMPPSPSLLLRSQEMKMMRQYEEKRRQKNVPMSPRAVESIEDVKYFPLPAISTSEADSSIVLPFEMDPIS